MTQEYPHELALFAGGAGGILASQWLKAFRTVCYVEFNAHCQKTLAARIQDGFLDPAPIWDDVRTFDGLPAALIALLNEPDPWYVAQVEPTAADIQQAANDMLQEMSYMQLEVILTPSQLPEIACRSGMIRTVVNQNPAWYQALCAQYPPQRRKPRRGRRGAIDTAIKRNHTLAALERIASGHNNTTYTERLMPFVREFARENG